MKKILIFLAVLALPVAAHAATLTVALSPASGGTQNVSVLLAANDSVNTVGARLLLPPGAQVQSFSDQTLLSYWVDAPAYDAVQGAVTFSGIIPNGWTGTNGRVLEFSVAGLAAGDTVSFDEPQTHAYRNDGLGTEEPLSFAAGTVSPAEGFGSPLLPLMLVLLFVALLSFLAYRLHRHDPHHEPHPQA